MIQYETSDGSEPANSRWRHQMEAFPRYWPFVRGIYQSNGFHVHIWWRHCCLWRGCPGALCECDALPSWTRVSPLITVDISLWLLQKWLYVCHDKMWNLIEVGCAINTCIMSAWNPAAIRIICIYDFVCLLSSATIKQISILISILVAASSINASF